MLSCASYIATVDIKPLSPPWNLTNVTVPLSNISGRDIHILESVWLHKTNECKMSHQYFWLVFQEEK